MFYPRCFFGLDIFCTNAHDIHWLIGAIFVKFSQLILMKIIKIVANRCQISRIKCTKFNFSDGSAPDFAALPQTPWLGLRGLLLRGEEEKEGIKGGRGPLYFFLRIYAHVKQCFETSVVSPPVSSGRASRYFVNCCKPTSIFPVVSGFVLPTTDRPMKSSQQIRSSSSH